VVGKAVALTLEHHDGHVAIALAACLLGEPRGIVRIDDRVGRAVVAAATRGGIVASDRCLTIMCTSTHA
jgi:hypothetical protein